MRDCPLPSRLRFHKTLNYGPSITGPGQGNAGRQRVRARSHLYGSRHHEASCRAPARSLTYPGTQVFDASLLKSLTEARKLLSTAARTLTTPTRGLCHPAKRTRCHDGLRRIPHAPDHTRRCLLRRCTETVVLTTTLSRHALPTFRASWCVSATTTTTHEPPIHWLRGSSRHAPSIGTLVSAPWTTLSALPRPSRLLPSGLDVGSPTPPHTTTFHDRPPKPDCMVSFRMICHIFFTSLHLATVLFVLSRVTFSLSKSFRHPKKRHHGIIPPFPTSLSCNFDFHKRSRRVAGIACRRHWD